MVVFPTMGKRFAYDISVIIPIYNGESFLSCAIESILNQTLGFHRIQLILVDDGSCDGSADICKRFKKQYPKNVVLLRQKNQGVSSARNRGLRKVKGKYTVFLDADDMWEHNSFSIMLDFFEEHYDEIDCLSTKVRIFGEKEYEHSMNFKYNGNEIIDINDHPDYLVTLAGNMMFKSSALKGIRFNENISLGEDTLFNTLVLKSKERYGQIDDAVFYYRKHSGGTLTDDRYHNKSWYLDYPLKVLGRIRDMSLSEFGIVKDYVQQLIAYWIRFAAVDHGIHDVLSEKEFSEFDIIFNDLLLSIDDRVISSLKSTPLITRNHLLEMKNGESIFENAITDKNGKLRYKKQIIFNPSGKGLVTVENCTVKEDHVIVEGTTMICRAEGYCDLYAFSSENTDILIKIEPTERVFVQYMYNNRIANTRERFYVKIPILSSGRIQFVTKYKNDNSVYCPGLVNSQLLIY